MGSTSCSAPKFPLVFNKQTTQSLKHLDVCEQLYLRVGCIGEAHVFAGLGKPSLC